MMGRARVASTDRDEADFLSALSAVYFTATDFPYNTMNTPFFKRIPWSRVNWTTSIFLAAINSAAVIGVPIYLWVFGIEPYLWIMFAALFILTGLSITLGYHRLFAHLSFRAKSPVKLLTLIFGACAFENSALDWCSDHRKHHKHVDHDDDPYDITKGFMWAHIGWLLFKLGPEMPMDNVNDLRKDKLVMWQHRWFLPLAFGVGLAMPAGIGFAVDGWVGALGGLLIPGVLRVFAVQHCTFFINSVCHTLGHRPYSSKCSARDSFLMALFTFGEGYHNYHHEFQHDYRNGVKKRSFDPTKWTIWILSKIGLASDLRRVPREKILIAEMGELKKRFDSLGQEHLESCHDTIRSRCQYLVRRLHDNLRAVNEAWQQRIPLNKSFVDKLQKETRELCRLVSDLERGLLRKAEFAI
jgi:stearoyl-CoA desaturase (delta-9 desaturase)